MIGKQKIKTPWQVKNAPHPKHHRYLSSDSRMASIHVADTCMVLSNAQRLYEHTSHGVVRKQSSSIRHHHPNFPPDPPPPAVPCSTHTTTCRLLYCQVCSVSCWTVSMCVGFARLLVGCCRIGLCFVGVVWGPFGLQTNFKEQTN